MFWDAGARAFLGSGEAPNFHVALVAQPVDLQSGNPITVGYWTGHEEITISLGGVNRQLFATRGGLVIENPTYDAQLTIKQHRARMFGLSVQATDLLNAYDTRLKPLEYWWLCFSQGQAFQGAARIFKGQIHGMPQTVPSGGQGSALEITGMSLARLGTRTSTARKSHQSYLERGGDTSMEYASVVDVFSHTWGPRE